jgi:hypothetical protein
MLLGRAAKRVFNLTRTPWRHPSSPPRVLSVQRYVHAAVRIPLEEREIIYSKPTIQMEELKPVISAQKERKPVPAEDYSFVIMSNENFTLDSTYKRQLELESNTLKEAAVKYRESLESLTKMELGSSLAPSQRLLSAWFGMIREDIEKVLQIKGESFYEPLTQIPVDSLSVIVMHRVLGKILAQPSGVRLVELANEVSRAIQVKETRVHVT